MVRWRVDAMLDSSLRHRDFVLRFDLLRKHSFGISWESIHESIV